MTNAIRWSIGLMLSLFIGGPMVSAQQQGHQRMMMPRVPADKLEEARALTSPLAPSPDIVEQGKAIYEGKGTCINCHGAKGRGDGPGAASLNPPPRVFRSHGFWKHRSEGEIFWVIKYGSPGTAMIPFGGLLSDEEIWTVMQYERSFAGGPPGGGGPQGGGRHQGRGMMRHQSSQEGHGMESGAMVMPGQQVEPGKDVMDKAEKAKAAFIGIAQAITAANNHVPGTVLEAEFDAEENQAFWEVEIVTDDGKIMEVKVDSQTGAILSSEEEKPKNDQKPMRQGKRPQISGFHG
jgi:mono/diheme cytochrome c family protein